MSNNLQIIYPYYDNPQMLQIHFNFWRAYAPELWAHTKIILVDDGSPNHPLQGQLGDAPSEANIEAYRIKQNVPWGQNGAHNLGMHVAEEGWCVSTDIDHVVPAATLRYLYETEFLEDTYYTFARQQQGQPKQVGYKRHPNSWLLTRDTFWRSGGYDEDFCGYYGSDSVFRRALDEVAARVEMDIPLIVYDENDIPDANTREFGRKDSEYYSVKHPELAHKRRNWTKAENPLRFDWERIDA
jgi:hypothetical protein